MKIREVIELMEKDGWYLARTSTNALIKMASPFGRRLGRPQAPVAEGGPSAFPMGGTDGTGSSGFGGYGRPKRRL